MFSTIRNQVKLASIALAMLAISAASVDMAFAQGGHFVGTPVCEDTGLTVECTGKVAGLGGTTFQITIAAAGIATVECENPGGNVAPGQNTSVTVEGDTDPLPTPRNGQYRFRIESDSPEPLPSTPACPNDKWSANITDVAFTEATLTLLENGNVSDTITVPVVD